MRSPRFLRSFGRGFGELILLFLGITLALGFENWNAHRIERLQELELLASLEADLNETLADLRRDQAQSETSLRNFVALVDYEGLGATPDDISSWLASLFTDARVFAQYSTYESLKSIGFDIVENPRLRSEISSFYELRLGRASVFEEAFHDVRDRLVLPVLLPYLSQSQGRAILQDEWQIGSGIRASFEMGLKDPAGFATDPKVRIMLRELVNAESRRQIAYLAAIEAAVALGRSIAAERAARS